VPSSKGSSIDILLNTNISAPWGEILKCFLTSNSKDRPLLCIRTAIFASFRGCDLTGIRYQSRRSEDVPFLVRFSAGVRPAKLLRSASAESLWVDGTDVSLQASSNLAVIGEIGPERSDASEAVVIISDLEAIRRIEPGHVQEFSC
jgi:hypothetical protein